MLKRAFRLSPLTPWATIAAIVLVVIIATTILVGLRGAAHQAAEDRVGAAMGTARGEAQAEAGSIVDAAHDAASASEDLTRKNADAIDHAPGADQRLDPGFNDAVRRSVCERASYRGTPECVQLLGPEEPARRR